jgi:hypothetical protein
MGGSRAMGSGREPRVMRVGVARRRRAGRMVGDGEVCMLWWRF